MYHTPSTQYNRNGVSMFGNVFNNHVHEVIAFRIFVSIAPLQTELKGPKINKLGGSKMCLL